MSEDVYREPAQVMVNTLCDARPGAMTYLAMLSEDDAFGRALRAAVDAARAPLLARIAAVRAKAEQWANYEAPAEHDDPAITATVLTARENGRAILALLDTTEPPDGPR